MDQASDPAKVKCWDRAHLCKAPGVNLVCKVTLSVCFTVSSVQVLVGARRSWY